MASKEILPTQETFPSKTETWLVDTHSFNNGFWHDKKRTTETTITNQSGEKIYCQSGQWEIRYQGEIIAAATSCIFSDTGLPWIKINPVFGINPEQRQVLEASLKHYGATRTT